VMEQMLGPGRHFYCPLWWERTLVDDILIEPGELAIVTSLVGNNTPAETGSTGGDRQYLVEGELDETTAKGALRRVYGPGRYRINPYAYDVKKVKGVVTTAGQSGKIAGWVKIETGHVGVVTNQTSNPRAGTAQGIQPVPLPPGLYAVNPREQQIDVIPIGYREKTLQSVPHPKNKGEWPLDESGEPEMTNATGGIVFPSRDGFTIHMDFTAIWGILPAQAPRVVEFSGNIEAVEQRVVVPLIESICRNEGSKLGAVELLVGETREHFQDEATEQFETRLRETGVDLQYGLVRHIYIPKEVRVPIQQKYLADELTLTREQEQLTARIEADLREQERTVELEAERIKVETEKLVAEKQAEGKKKAAETRAETTKQVAAIDRQTAELESEATVLRGEAEADSQKLMEAAKASRFELAVKAFGEPAAFNQWVFATGLPDDLQLQWLYAGEGTFWTDLKGLPETLLSRQVREQQASRPRSSKTTGKAQETDGETPAK